MDPAAPENILLGLAGNRDRGLESLRTATKNLSSNKTTTLEALGAFTILTMFPKNLDELRAGTFGIVANRRTGLLPVIALGVASHHPIVENAAFALRALCVVSPELGLARANQIMAEESPGPKDLASNFLRKYSLSDNKTAKQNDSSERLDLCSNLASIIHHGMTRTDGMKLLCKTLPTSLGSDTAGTIDYQAILYGFSRFADQRAELPYRGR